MPQPPRNFVWYELMTTDALAAQRFYRDVVGWHMHDSGIREKPHTIISAGGKRIGGIASLPERGLNPGWIGYVSVDDVDGSAALFAKAGGFIRRAPIAIPGVGRLAVVADPQGAALTLCKGESDAAPEAVARGAPGHVSWRELHAADREAAFAFYAALFGWTRGKAVDLGATGVYQLFAAGGKNIGGIMTKLEAAASPFWLYYFNVSDINAAADRVKAGGGRIIKGPREVTKGEFSLEALDPQGAIFALVAL